MVDQSKRMRPVTSDPYELMQRVNRRRSEYQREERSANTMTDRIPSIRTLFERPERVAAFFSQRMVMHLLVVSIIPLALLISKTELVTLVPDIGSPTSVVRSENNDFTVDVAPITSDSFTQGDAPLTESEDLPVPISLISRNETMAPVVIPVKVLVDSAYMRNGPGKNYDPIIRASSGLELQVIGKYKEWYQVRERIDAPVYWMAGELLSLPENTATTMFDIFDKDVPPPPPPRTGTVMESGLILRDGPGKNYVALTTLKLNSDVELLETYQDWYHIAVDEVDGWVKAEYIQTTPEILKRVIVADTAAIPDESPEIVGYVNGDEVNLRRGPDPRHAKIDSVKLGVKLDLIGKYKDWVQVSYNGKKSWIFKELLNVTSHVLRRVPTTTDFPALPVAPMRSRNPAANVSTSSDVANIALQYVGYRYTWGGTSPRSGFDCSGLMMYAFSQVGVSIPRLASSQSSASNGVQVGGYENLAPGDMMFFKNTSGRRGITHVSMYIGGGKMVHAMTPTYGVQISNIYDDYWVNHYAGGVRIKR